MNEQETTICRQDVSDRVEKLDYHVDPLKTLEKNSKHITRDDFNLHLDPSITFDLRKYRTYQGSSVRDLLRALRNKVSANHSRYSPASTSQNNKRFAETSLPRIDASNASTFGQAAERFHRLLDRALSAFTFTQLPRDGHLFARASI